MQTSLLMTQGSNKYINTIQKSDQDSISQDPKRTDLADSDLQGFLCMLIGIVDDKSMPNTDNPSFLVNSEGINAENKGNKLTGLQYLIERNNTNVEMEGKADSDTLETNQKIGKEIANEGSGKAILSKFVLEIGKVKQGNEKENVNSNRSDTLSNLLGQFERDYVKSNNGYQPAGDENGKEGVDTEKEYDTKGMLLKHPTFLQNGKKTFEKIDAKGNENVKISGNSNENGQILDNSHKSPNLLGKVERDYVKSNNDYQPAGNENGKEIFGKTDAKGNENVKISGSSNENGQIDNQTIEKGNSNKTETLLRMNSNAQEIAKINTNPNRVVVDQVQVVKSEIENQAIKAITLQMNKTDRPLETNKVFRIDPDKGQNTLLSSNSQFFERIYENTSAAKRTEEPQQSFKAEVLTKVIEKAVLNLKSGQSAISINLKPKSLGRMRLKILIENHHVMLKIFTEAPLVKHIIENNMNNLRFDLQNNGLELDKFDVFVAQDSGQNAGKNGNYEHTNIEYNSDEIENVLSEPDVKIENVLANRGMGDENNSIDILV